MKNKDMEYAKRLERQRDLYEAVTNEWYSVGAEPNAEDVIKLRCISRKLNRMYKQFGLLKYAY